MEIATTDGLLDEMIKVNQMLEEIKAGVNQYIEQKQLYFTRFMFLSNDEILKILSETKNPENVQPYLYKCFQGIHHLQIDDGINAFAILSSGNEKLNFKQSINIPNARGCVEIWLREIEIEMKLAVQHEIKNSYDDYLISNRADWILNWPQMVILLIAQIFWTSDVHSCLSRNDKTLLKNILSETLNELDDFISLIRTEKLEPIHMSTLRSLCMQNIHARDVIQKLLESINLNAEIFDWIAQFRYYRIDDEIEPKILFSNLKYQNEYLGNFEKLVFTPLTDRCIRTVILANQHQLCASLFGPAGTGKSETIKDLSRSLAAPFRSFSCSYDLDHISFVKFLKGTISCGAWMCFEDFDRISENTLSIVAQYLRDVTSRIKSSAKKIMLDGYDIQIDSNCFIAIVSNPNYPMRTKM